MNKKASRVSQWIFLILVALLLLALRKWLMLGLFGAGTSYFMLRNSASERERARLKAFRMLSLTALIFGIWQVVKYLVFMSK